jgi:hypothetical protein
MAFPAIGFRGALGTIHRRMMAARVVPGVALAGLVASNS